jgi:hypothetical protein
MMTDGAETGICGKRLATLARLQPVHLRQASCDPCPSAVRTFAASVLRPLPVLQLVHSRQASCDPCPSAVRTLAASVCDPCPSAARTFAASVCDPCRPAHRTICHRQPSAFKQHRADRCRHKLKAKVMQGMSYTCHRNGENL